MGVDRATKLYVKVGETAGLALVAVFLLAVVGGVFAAAIAGVLGDTYPALESMILSTLKEGASLVITGPVLDYLALSVAAYGFGLLILTSVRSSVSS